MTKGNFLNLLFFLIVCAANAQTNIVGFDRTVLSDSTRLFGTTHRPIVVNYWYPAISSNSAKPLTYRDYVLASTFQLDLAQVTNGDRILLEEQVRSNLNYFDVMDEEFIRILSMPAKAVSAASPAKGKHKLVVVVGGTQGSNTFFTSLAERLSAQGFVVATLSSVGASDSIPCTYDTACIQNQTRDLAVLVDYFRKKNWIEPSNVSLLAWSFGGLSSLYYHQQFQTVKSIVSFDSALGYEYGTKLIAESRLFDSSNFNLPILHFRSLKSGRRTRQDMSFFNSFSNNGCKVINLRKLLHAQLTSLYGPVLDYGRGKKTFSESDHVLAETIDFLKLH
jgi:pimeloyl-ACP methyl ester carboxylesterase